MINPESSSFRDPDARVIKQGEQFYRIIFNSYKANYDQLINSGLKEELTSLGVLVSEKELSDISFLKLEELRTTIYKVLQPEVIPFISYPYEWSFSQLKAAALLTLEIQKRALNKGMSLKDASAYNVQFVNGKAQMIDTSSFEAYAQDEPWVAYGQFCRHFFGPLLLYKHNKAELVRLSQIYLDGIPLSVISKCLPKTTYFNFSAFSHIHYHAKLETQYAQTVEFKNKQIKLSKDRLVAIISHLQGVIKGIELPKQISEWTDYYSTCSYKDDSFEHKKQLVDLYLSGKQRGLLLDMGCNEGEFSFLAAKHTKLTVSIDFDAKVIERLTRRIKKEKQSTILPLVIDMVNPSPGIGWVNTERTAFLKRAKFDTVLALALIHHLAIGNNLPLKYIAQMFAHLTKELIIEFVPINDPQTQRLLITKKNIFDQYTEENFRMEFGKYYNIVKEDAIRGTERKLFWLISHA